MLQLLRDCGRCSSLLRDRKPGSQLARFCVSLILGRHQNYCVYTITATPANACKENLKKIFHGLLVRAILISR